MTLNIHRRAFLGSSVLLCALPAKLFASQSKKVVLRFAVLSDIHYPGNPAANEVKRFKKALEFIRYYAKFDAMVVAGDMSNRGIIKEIGPFKKDLDEGKPKDIRTLLCMGNHEFWGGSRELWEQTFETPGNTHEIVNGYHFIGISPEKGTCRNGDYLYCKDWVREQLDKAEKDTPNQPIFVFQHYHLSGTVYGSLKNHNVSGTNDLNDLFEKHPRVIHFSGHSHYPIRDPRSAWQGAFTAFGTGTLSYMGVQRQEPGCSNRPEGAFNVAEFYVVEVDETGSVILRPYDLIAETFADFVYTVAEPGHADKYLYTDARYKRTKKPYWKSGSAVAVENVHFMGATFRFPQAMDDEKVHSYRLSFYRRNGNNWSEPFHYYAWSNYFYHHMPEIMTVPVNCLESGSDYRLEIRARDCFQHESEPLTAVEFRTTDDPVTPELRHAPHPKADVLAIRFQEPGPVNLPNHDTMKKPVETFGKPVIANDVAEFNGKSDSYIVRFNADEYAQLNRRISFGTRFSFKEFSPDKKTESIFSNTEQGGYGLSLDHTKKAIVLWLDIQGRYVNLSTPVTPGEFHTAYVVYNGTEVLLYLDGKPVAKSKHSGEIHYTKNEKSRAFCIGGDIDHRGLTSNHFEGKISFAEVYSWALNSEQIKNLSQNEV